MQFRRHKPHLRAADGRPGRSTEGLVIPPGQQVTIAIPEARPGDRVVFQYSYRKTWPRWAVAFILGNLAYQGFGLYHWPTSWLHWASFVAGLGCAGYMALHRFTDLGLRTVEEVLDVPDAPNQRGDDNVHHS